jgi:hypothetical protein
MEPGTKLHSSILNQMKQARTHTRFPYTQINIILTIYAQGSQVVLYP